MYISPTSKYTLRKPLGLNFARSDSDGGRPLGHQTKGTPFLSIPESFIETLTLALNCARQRGYGDRVPNVKA